MTTLKHAGADEVIDRLPNDDETINRATATLEFQGEAWVDDHARAVDDGTTTFTVPLADLYIPLTDFISAPGKNTDDWAIHHTTMSHHVSDCFHRHDNAPDWVQNWDGPFTIKLTTWGI